LVFALDSVFKAIFLIKFCMLCLFILDRAYLTAGQRHMLQRVLHRTSSRGFTPLLLWSRYTSRECSLSSFHHSCRQAHCLTVKPRPPGVIRHENSWSWVWIAYY